MNSGKKNEVAWQSLFDKYAILAAIDAHGSFTITANQIREFREPRLMAKFDHLISLPDIFRKNRLAILPVSRGEYILSHFDCFMPVHVDTSPIVHATFPDNIQSIDPNNITSEAIALNCAMASGIFSDFFDEEQLIPTVCGRMGSGSFDFHVNNQKSGSPLMVTVNNAQIEIDSALEGIDCLSLVEAKCDISDDFIIRQLFYPFKTWERRVSKKVRLVYLVYSNGVFTLY